MLAELDQIISLLEAEIPANQSSPQNRKLKERLEKELVRYFDRLARAFPYSRLAAIYNRNVLKESVGSEAGAIIDPLLAAFDEALAATLEGQLTEIYVSGQAQVISFGKTSLGVPITFEGPPVRQAVDFARKRGATLVKGMNEETKKRLAHTISQAIENKRGVPGLARDIRSTFSDMSKNRSVLIARTETADALSQASLENMKEMGIDGKAWVTVGDAQVSDECSANEAQGTIKVGQAFTSGPMAPPQHPNAVFAGYGFFPYGRLCQMLSSRYDGPAIAIEAERIKDGFELPSGDSARLPNGPDGDVLSKHFDSGGNLLVRDGSGKAIAVFPQRIQITIGPNHPILTRSGFVKAHLLNEGYELLYDGWCELPYGFAESNLKKVHLIEDTFESAASVFGYTNIAAPSNYFHGDESFCHGEIKVVRKDRDLLPEGNTGISEHLSECDLTGAYADPEHVTSCRRCQEAFSSIFAAPPSGVSSSGHSSALSGREPGPSFPHGYRLISVHRTSFTGMAFDASTSTELYNIGGLVVKNCRCALAPSRLRK